MKTMEYFDKDGNPIEGLITAEELEQKIADAVKANADTTPPVTPPATPETPPATPETPPETVDISSILTEINNLKNELNTFKSGSQSVLLSKYDSDLDDTKKTEFKNRFESLNGYGDTPSDIEKKAQDAYLLVTGTRFDSNTMNMQNLGMSNMSKNNSKPPEITKQIDADLSTALGNTEDDVKKYSQ